ncbi:MAG: CDP-glycerol glycerophosphotransferase family protein [Clostridiales bacterium]|nr:CDP-glycerol glycerophosphotransferase family protein [Clostridiales bacterium]
MKMLKKLLVQGTLFVFIRKKIEVAIGVFFRKVFYSHNKVKKNKVFFMTYNDQYCDNEKYIAEEILRQKLPLDIVWAQPKKGNKPESFPAEVRTVKRGTFEMFEEQATARIWFDNALNCVWYRLPKKKSQVYINTWHGSLGIKRLGGDKKWMKLAKRCKSRTDYCTTNSKFEEDVFRSTFWPTNEFMKIGHPRNDILINADRHAELRQKVCEELEIPEGKKIALYAPTFRDDGDMSCLNMNYEKIRQALEEKFGGEWVILLRLHFKNIKSAEGIIRKNKKIINASNYFDMQELMAATDIGITDYSSWAYDFILTKRPLFIYATDIEKYNTDRGFYYSLDTTPFPIATDNYQMLDNIKSFDNNKYQADVQSFLDEKGCYETGNASALVVEKIKEIVGLD